MSLNGYFGRMRSLHELGWGEFIRDCPITRTTRQEFILFLTAFMTEWDIEDYGLELLLNVLMEMEKRDTIDYWLEDEQIKYPRSDMVEEMEDEQAQR